MKFRKYDTEAIKQAIAPHDFYSRRLTYNLKYKGGWVNAGLCPFHADRQSGSFHVHLSSGAYKCFACGAKGGGIIDFTMEFDNLSFVEAMAMLTQE